LGDFERRLRTVRRRWSDASTAPLVAVLGNRDLVLLGRNTAGSGRPVRGTVRPRGTGPGGECLSPRGRDLRRACRNCVFRELGTPRVSDRAGRRRASQPGAVVLGALVVRVDAGSC